MERFENISKHLATCSVTGNEPVFAGGQGAHLITETGEDWLCMNDIASVLGFHHEGFVNGVAQLVRTKLLCHAGSVSDEKERLIANFMKATHGDFDRIMISGSGGETVDWSVKVARKYTGRDGIVSFSHALHGRSFAGAWLSDIPHRKEPFGTGLENTFMWDYPSDGRAFEPDTGALSDIAAVIIEPYQAIGGMDSPSKEYWKWLRSCADENGFLIIMDEIQTGFGKTGSFFAYEESGIVPDILLCGKGMSNGFGMGAMLMTKEVGACVEARHLSGGSADNSVMCGAVNLVFEIMEKENILENVNRVGDYLRRGMGRVLESKGIPFAFHGKGLYFSCEVPEGIPARLSEASKSARILMGATKTRICVRTPLVLTEKDADAFCAFIESAI